MRIAIFTLGTRGDVQPFMAIGREAIKHGHSVVICTGESFRDLIENNGIEFAKAELDLMELLNTKDGQDIFNNGIKHIIKAMKYAKKNVNPAYRETLDQFYDCAKDSDMIIYHPKALGAQDIALYMKIPCICVSPVPFIYPISEFPNPMFSYKRNFGKTLNKITYLPVKYAESSNIKEVNDFRKTTFQAPKRKIGIYTYEIENQEIPIVYPVSRFLFEDIKSWEGKVYLSGFVFLNNEEDLSKEIVQFVSKGSRPIIVSFSSAPLKKPQIFKAILTEALKKSNNRAIILTGMSGMSFKHEKDILAVSSASHNSLFPLSKGVIHHGGVGTMASALKSGKPQIIMPFSSEQSFWANRLHEKGYALKPIIEDDLTIDKLVQLFNDIDKKEIIYSAVQIKEHLSTENGNKNIVEYIEKVYSDYNMSK